jgi:hypothetical protein
MGFIFPVFLLFPIRERLLSATLNISGFTAALSELMATKEE